MAKKEVRRTNREDLNKVIEYPKKVGDYEGSAVMLHLGPYGIYMKYNDKMYKISYLKDYSLDSLLSVIRK